MAVRFATDTRDERGRALGSTPAIALCDPRYSRNVGMIVRIASCYGIRQVWFSGQRIREDLRRFKRLPREERLKGYREVELRWSDRFFEGFSDDVVPVAVEVRAGTENLFEFEHPEKALYVFGPEDGSIPKVLHRHCHRFVVIPTRHCLNLAMAVGTVLYDRAAKRRDDSAAMNPARYENRGAPGG